MKPAHVAVLVLLATAACRPGSPEMQHALQEIEAANDSARDRARAQVASGQDVDVHAEVERVQAAARSAGAAVPGSDGAVMRASATVLERIQSSADSHQEALQAFLSAGGLDFTGLTPESLDLRRSKLDLFCEANEEMRAMTARLPDELGAAVRAEGGSELAAKASVRGFMSTFPQESVLRMRKLDADFCGQARLQFDILADMAGRWEVSRQGLMFHDSVGDAIIDRFNVSLQEIQRIGEEQQELQRLMLARG